MITIQVECDFNLHDYVTVVHPEWGRFEYCRVEGICACQYIYKDEMHSELRLQTRLTADKLPIWIPTSWVKRAAK